MATQCELKLVYKHAKIPSWLSAINARWDNRAKTLSVKSTRKQMIRNFLCLCLCSYWAGFSAWRLLFVLVQRNYHHSTRIKFELSFVLLYAFNFICFTIGALMILAFAARRPDMVALFNQLLVLNRKLDVGTGPAKERREKLFQLAMWLFSYMVFPVTAILLCCVEIHYTWINTFNAWRATLSGFLIVWNCIGTGAMYPFLLTYVYLYFIVIKKLLCLEWNSNVSGSPLSQRELWASVVNYRMLTVLCSYFNTTYCTVIVPALKFCIILLCIFCFVMGISLKNVQSAAILALARGLIATGVYVFVSLVAFGSMMCSLWEVATRFIIKFRQEKVHNADRATRKIGRASCRERV